MDTRRARRTRPLIAFTVHDRPRYLAETLASWSRARGAADADLIFRCEPGCEEAAAMCAAAAAWAASAEVIVNPRRLGVLSNPWHALDLCFSRGAPFAVLAEEDTPVADDVLEYLAWARAAYEADRQVAAVCAHYLGRPAAGDPAAVIRDRLFSPVVWGTWADRWAALLRDTWDHDYEHNGWDWHINSLLAGRDLRVIKPALSRSQHIGEHGGAHCTPGFYPQTVAASFREHYDPQVYREIR